MSTPKVNILFYVEPLIERGNPYWKEGWLNSFSLDMIQALRNSAFADQFRYGVMINEALDHKYNAIEDVEKFVLTQQDLMDSFENKNSLEVSLAWYHETYTSDQMAAYGKLLQDRLSNFVPDIVITYSPAPFFNETFKDVLVLHREYSLFSRSPFPESWFLDPQGVLAHSYLDKYWLEIRKSYQLDEIQKLRVTTFKTQIQSLLGEENPFSDLFDDFKKQFDHLILLPLQFSDYISFDGVSDFKSQYDYLIYVLDRVPKNIGVVVTTHPEYNLLSSSTIAFLELQYEHFIHHEAFEDYYGASQFLLSSVDGVVTVSSSVGMQTLMWDKKLIVLGQSFHYMADATSLDSIEEVLSAHPAEKDDLLHWMITHYSITRRYFYNGAWLGRFLQDSLEMTRNNGIDSTFFKVLDDEDSIFNSLLDDLDQNIPYPAKVPSYDRLTEKYSDLVVCNSNIFKLISKAGNEFLEKGDVESATELFQILSSSQSNYDHSTGNKTDNDELIKFVKAYENVTKEIDEASPSPSSDSTLPSDSDHELQGSEEYQKKLSTEISIYEHNTNVHDLPEIHHIYANHFLVPNLEKLTSCGDWSDWWIHDIDDLMEQLDRPVRMLSIACGNGDKEIELFQKIKYPEKLTLIGVDVNPEMVARAKLSAKEKGLRNVQFLTQDLNYPDLPDQLDIVVANHSLHHIVELERLFKEINNKSTDEMIFLINDMIGRNGHVMWDNTEKVVAEIWSRLDDRFKINAYSHKLDEIPYNFDCSEHGFEGIRAEDILQLLDEYFDIEMFFPFSTLMNRFIDRVYGNNFNPSDGIDLSIINQIIELDIKMLEKKNLAATQAFMRVKKLNKVSKLLYLFQTPTEVLVAREYPLSKREYRNEIDKFMPVTSHASDGLNANELKQFKKVSIVIPVFNNIDYTKDCIDALFKNTRYPNYEIVIVDNASTDGTGDYLAGLPGDHITIVSSKSNLGFVDGCNAGADACKGDFILLLNNDTEVEANWLKPLVEFMGEHEDCGAIGSKLVYPDKSLQEAGGIIFSDGNGWNYGRGENPNDPRFNYVREVDYCSGASLMIRSEDWEAIGGLDQRYAPAYYEDTDLCFSIRKLGKKVYYHPHSVVVHYEGKTAGTDMATGYKRYQPINRQKFLKKWEHELKAQTTNHPSSVTRASDRGSTKMNIMVIDPFLPFYDRASGSLRLFQILKILKQLGYHVTFISRTSTHHQIYKPILESLGILTVAGDIAALRSMGYEIDQSKDNLNYELLFAERSYQYVILDFWNLAEYYLPIVRKYSPRSKIIVDSIDIHFLREIREAELEKNQAKLKEARRKKKREIALYKLADRLWNVTLDDEAAISKYVSQTPMDIVPNIHNMIEASKSYKETSDFLFVGNFDHTPNIDAIVYLCEQIMPMVLKSLPDVKLYIVGNNPPKEILKYRTESVIITGYVEDLEPYLLDSRVSVSPLRYGAGMKGKIGEALSWGLPVVTTTIGAEGMNLEDETHALIADDVDTFAEAMIKLYNDENLWNHLSSSGKKYVEDRWSPKHAKQVIKEIFESSEFDKKPLVSIILLTYNALNYTKRCLDSILAHTSYPFELILVDNASTDGTPKYLTELVKNNSNFTLIENAENKGFAAGNNQGVAAANGKYVLLLNNDVLVAEGWLENLVAGLELDERIGMVGPITNHISGRQMLTDVPYKNDQDFFKFAAKVAAKNLNRITPRRRIAGFAVLMEKTLYQDVGGLDESFGIGNYEDDDLCLKVSREGYAIMVHEGVFIHHYGSQTFIANKMDYTAALESKGKVFRQKWPNVDYDELIELKSPLNDLHPKMLQTGMAGLETGDYEVAYDTLKQLIDENPLHEDAFIGLIMAARITERIEEAIIFTRRLLRLSPDNAVAYNLSGLIASDTGNYEAAQKFFRIATEKDANLLDARRNYAEVLIIDNKFQEGVKAYLDIISDHPDDIIALLRMAELNIEADHTSDAVNYAKLVLEVDPTQAHALSILENMATE